MASTATGRCAVALFSLESDVNGIKAFVRMSSLDQVQSGIEQADLDWAYRTLLERDPEPDPNLLANWRTAAPDLKGLVTLISQSDEYRMRGRAPSYVCYDVGAEGQAATLELLSRLSPVSVAGFEKVRIGGEGDGGYVMLDDFEGVEAAYSLGIGDDVSWDLDIAAKGIDVHQYDHTIDALPSQHSRFRWNKIEIGPVSAGTMDSLANQIRANGHAAFSQMVLKCDIEGAEWSVFAGMDDEVLAQFRQIVLELHFVEQIRYAAIGSPAKRSIEQLTRNHRVVHVHANNHAGYSIVCGIPIPTLLELTFVRADDGKVFRPTDEVFPTPLDRPCLTGRADYRLGHFRY